MLGGSNAPQSICACSKRPSVAVWLKCAALLMYAKLMDMELKCHLSTRLTKSCTFIHRFRSLVQGIVQKDKNGCAASLF